MEEASIQQQVNITNKSSLIRSNEFTETLDLSKAKASNLLPKLFISPIFMMWDITYRCPFKCLFCFNDSGTHVNKNELMEKDLLRIADDIIKEQVVSVCLCGGEPFIRLKEFIKLTERLSEGGVIVNCVSNGWYINSAILEEIHGGIKTVQLSLDGPDPYTHDLIRGKKGAFNQVINAIHCIAQSSFHTCELTFIPTRINYRLFPNVVELATILGCVSKIRTQHLIQTGRGYNRDFVLNRQEENEFEEIFMQTLERYNGKIELIFGDPWAHINDWIKGLVPPLFLQITAQGTAKISPYIPLTVGDLKQESLGLIWQRINYNRGRIIEFLNNFHAMNSYSENQIPWINNDVDLLAYL